MLEKGETPRDLRRGFGGSPFLQWLLQVRRWRRELGLRIPVPLRTVLVKSLNSGPHSTVKSNRAVRGLAFLTRRFRSSFAFFSASSLALIVIVTAEHPSKAGERITGSELGLSGYAVSAPRRVRREGPGIV
jgi:hypothetical protein